MSDDSDQSQCVFLSLPVYPTCQSLPASLSQRHRKVYLLLWPGFVLQIPLVTESGCPMTLTSHNVSFSPFPSIPPVNPCQLPCLRGTAKPICCCGQALYSRCH